MKTFYGCFLLLALVSCQHRRSAEEREKLQAKEQVLDQVSEEGEGFHLTMEIPLYKALAIQAQLTMAQGQGEAPVFHDSGAGKQINQELRTQNPKLYEGLAKLVTDLSYVSEGIRPAPLSPQELRDLGLDSGNKFVMGEFGFRGSKGLSFDPNRQMVSLELPTGSPLAKLKPEDLDRYLHLDLREQSISWEIQESYQLHQRLEEREKLAKEKTKAAADRAKTEAALEKARAAHWKKNPSQLPGDEGAERKAASDWEGETRRVQPTPLPDYDEMKVGPWIPDTPPPATRPRGIRIRP